MALRIDSEWIDLDPDVKPEFDATFGRLGINANGAWLTAFETQHGARGDRIEVPAYPLAEWIAENWWALLHEPEKEPSSKHDPGFRARHWLGTAREGFALPDAWIFSGGRESIEIQSKATLLSHARMVFPTEMSAQLVGGEVELALRIFVASVITRLDEKGYKDTLLQQIWSVFNELDQNERKFARLLGAMGLSPYSEEGGIEIILNDFMKSASERVTEDLCEASDEGDFVGAAEDTLRSLKELDNEPEIDLSSIFSIGQLRARKPWRLGLDAANAVRARLNINPADREGGTRFFDHLSLSDFLSGNRGFREAEDPVVHGSLRRSANRLQTNLIRIRPESRRFDAARSCFLAWNQASEGERLITKARVPDQQASRAFAAELLAPIQYIRSRTSNNLLSPFRAAEIADELSVSQAVVTWQANNNSINIVGNRQQTRSN